MDCSETAAENRPGVIDILVLLLLVGLTAAGIFWLFQCNDPTVWTVAVAAGITALTTGFGAIPFLFGRCPSKNWTGIGNAIAAGLMFGASVSLLVEGWVIHGVDHAPERMLVGALVGVILVRVAHRLLSGNEELEGPEAFETTSLVRMILVVGVMTVHSFAEGMGVGVSYGDGNGFGDFIALSIAIHNIPEGLAICLVLIPAGNSVTRGALWSVFSSLPQPLIAVPSYLFVLWFRPLLPSGLGLAAGAMLWMVFSELLPEACESISKGRAILWMVSGASAMWCFQLWVG